MTNIYIVCNINFNSKGNIVSSKMLIRNTKRRFSIKFLFCRMAEWFQDIITSFSNNLSILQRVGDFDKIFRKIMLWWNCQITSWQLNPWQRMILTYMLHNIMHASFIQSFVLERSAANKLGWALNSTLAAIQISRCKYRWLSFLFQRWCFERISGACPVVTWTSGNERGVQKLFNTTI